MNLNWLESVLYGLVSGFAEFLPISSNAHQLVLMHLCGAGKTDPARNLFIHIALLLAVYTCLRTTLDSLRREKRQRSSTRHHTYVSRNHYDIQLIRNAVFPMLAGLFLISYIFKQQTNLLFTALFFIINGIVLFLPDRMMQGNKDARSMSAFDSILLGLSGALSALPGVSRVGSMTSLAVARGASRQNALHWALLLSIPALIALIFLDVLSIVTVGGSVSFFSNLFSYILSALFAYVGGYLGTGLMRFLTVRVGFSGFAYYSWGAGLLTFLLYLTAA